MRHRNPTSCSRFSGNYGRKVYAPYRNGNWTWTKPTRERSYIKVLNFVAKHPGCKRIDIIRAVWRPNITKENSRGYMSSLFACLLFDNFLDYNSKYEYTITRRGYHLLCEAQINTLRLNQL
jgi:hypothetical protein